MTLRGLILSVCMFYSTVAFGQNETSNSFKSFSFGFQLNQFQSDFGVGLNLSSPYFGNKVSVALNGEFNFQWLQHLDSNGSTTWTAYENIILGLKFGAPLVADFFRYYGEAGAIMILPDSEFSSSTNDYGAYGLFGFEFLFSELKGVPRGYFIELGGMGTGARADKVPGSPIYSNGFLISVGLRFYTSNT